MERKLINIIYEEHIREVPKWDLLKPRFWKRVYFIGANILPFRERVRAYLKLCGESYAGTEPILDNEYNVLFLHNKYIDNQLEWDEFTEMRNYDNITTIQRYIYPRHFDDMFSRTPQQERKAIIT